MRVSFTSPETPARDAAGPLDHWFERAEGPSERFAKTESLGGIVLLVTTVLALAWANSPWRASYFHLWETSVGITIGGRTWAMSLHHLINDGLMAIFFFVVGLEIKREVLAGELASLRRAALPIAAAVGGMVVPALIYAAFNAGGPGAPGWGTPMATDIAFALGIMALLGSRAPASLKIFLAALAIVDDLGAVLVIALFYTAQLSVTALGVAAGALAVLGVMNGLRVRQPVAYLLVGLVLWGAVLQSGIHATIAGVLLAMMVPATTRLDTPAFLARTRQSLTDFVHAAETGEEPILANKEQLEAVHDLETACEQVQTPLQRMEHELHTVVAFGIVPIFALANAGIAFGGASAMNAVTVGVLLGLLLGKPLGIVGASWLAVKLRWAELPAQTSWAAVTGVACLGGIGFTMSLFIAGLAFGPGALLDQAKIGVLAGSLVSGVLGWIVLSRLAARKAGA